MSGPARRSVLGLIGAGALTSCGLTVDDSVRPGLDVDVPRDRDIQYLPEGPAPGMGPEEIVMGFLRASAAAGPSLSVARSYLTAAASSGWRPDEAHTMVMTDADPRIRVSGRTVRIDTRLAARIDTDGRFSLAPATDGAMVRFGMTRESGEWRISTLQKGFGRLLPLSRVDQTYRRYRVHYAAIGWNRLVPDLRWIPSDQEATRLVRLQLGRVPDHLVGAVQTDVDARLSVDAVPVSEGVATVDLREGLSTDPTVRRHLAAQLVASLMQLPEVMEVELSIEGSTVDIPGVERPWTSPSQFGFVEAGPSDGRSAVIRDGTRLVRVALDEVTTVDARGVVEAETPFAAVPPEWSELAISLDGKEVAGVRDSGEELVRWFDSGQSRAVEAFATDMARPVFDTSDVLWVAGTGETPSSRLWVVNTSLDPKDPAAVPTEVPALWLSGRVPRSVSVSPDGACLAVISTGRDGTDQRIQVSGIARQPNGMPTATATRALDVAAVVEELLDLAWITPTTLAVLGRRPTDRSVRPLLVEVGGEISPLEPVSGARLIGTTGGVRDLVVTTASHRSYTRTGGSWRRLPSRRAVVVPSA